MSGSKKKSEGQKERRGFSRIRCSLPAKIARIGDKHNLSEVVRVHEFSEGGLKLSIDFINLNPGSNIELEYYDPDVHLSTALAGEVRWRKFVGNKFEVGLEIKELLSVRYG